MDKIQWEENIIRAADDYLCRNDGCFDSHMKACLEGFNYEDQTVSFRFETQGWQRNERGHIHGGAIAGMFDTALGVVANFAAGKNEATTADMNVTYLRPVEFGQNTIVKVYIVKMGKTMIRLRAEMFCQKTGKLAAAATGSWIPL